MLSITWVVPANSQKNNGQGDASLPDSLKNLNHSLKQAGFNTQLLRDDKEVHGENVVLCYYFAKTDDFSVHQLKDDIHISKGDTTLALLDFPVEGVCHSAAILFADLILLEGQCDVDSGKLLQSLKHIQQRKQPILSQSLLDACFRMKFVGKSLAYKNVVAEVNKMLGCKAPVLIEGETGTGKELLARALHYLGPDSESGFVPVNCAAIPDSLFESELFGHEKGAFTHAQSKHIGLVEIAEGGTLFLDEVDSLSSKAQTALLRFLQTGEYRAVGSTTFKRAKVRVVSASNTPLKQAIERVGFREDLYFRLNVLKLDVPPLRERGEDIELIATHLLKRFEEQYQRGKKLLHPNLLAWLQQQEWPGNVRELENDLLRRYLLSDTTVMSLLEEEGMPSICDKLNEDISITTPFSSERLSFNQAKQHAIDCFTERYLSSMLALTDGNITHAAALAGKERRAFGKLVKKYNVRI